MKQKTIPKRLISLFAIVATTLLLLIATNASADSATTDFESFSLGSVDGQGGWSETGSFDVEVVDATGYGYASFGSKSLRISNAVTSGSFGDQTFSKSLTDEAGETDAENNGLSGGTRQPYFEASWDIASTVPGAEQPGLQVTVSPDRGDGARMSWIQIADTPTGLEVNFYGYDTSLGGTCSDLTNFVFTQVASGLDRSVPHNIRVTMEFVDGINNDVMNVYVDGNLVHTGKTWEDFFRNCQPPGSRTVDSLLFRVSGTAAPTTSGNGFLIDNVELYSGPVPCTTDCYVDAATGSDSNGGTAGSPFATIQKAIDSVDPNGTVHVADGTYNEAPNVNKPVTIDGASKAGVIIDASSINDYSIDVTADDVTLQDFTLIGNPGGSAAYGIKVAGPSPTRLSNFTVENVLVDNSRRTGIDLNGVDGALIKDVEVKNVPSGNGLAITDSNDVTFENITTSNNAWGGLAIYTYGRYFSLGSDNIVIQGTNSFGEANKVYVQRGNFNDPGNPEPVTNLTVNGFDYTVMNDTFRAGGENFTFYQRTQSDAIAYALALATPADSYVNEIATGDFWVGQDATNSMTIQTAVDHATAGDTIHVLPGTYAQGSQIVIDKDVTIIGDAPSTTTLKPGFDTGSSGDSRGWFLVNAGVVFHLSNVTLDGDGNKVFQAIRHKGEGTITNVDFKNIRYGQYLGFGMAAFGTGPVDVYDSSFSNIERVGVLYFGPGVSGSNFHNNTYTGKGPGDWLDYALDISAGAVIDVTNNNISGNRGVASSDGSTSAGILVTTFFGAGTEATITENTITDSTTGIFVGYDDTDTSTVAANFNNITSNDNGVKSTAPTVDATCNWWGAADGPSGEGSGSGDSVSEHVTFDPWLIGPAPDSPCGIQTGSITVTKFHDVDKDGEQDADEDNLSGWTFNLKDSDDNTIASSTTNSDGIVTFNDVPYGTYEVCEELQAGWVNSTPLCQTVVLSGGNSVTPGPDSVTITSGSSQFQIEFLGTSNNGLTWNYEVSELAGQSLSHWVLGICEDAEVVAYSPTANDAGIEEVTIGLDPTTGVDGIKWDVNDNFDNDGGEEDDSRTFSITLSEVYPVGTTAVAIKTGGGSTGVSDAIAGPHCGDSTGTAQASLFFGNYEEEDETLITLSEFAARAQNGSVILTWETAAEIDNAGFNLYRATSPAGPFVKVNDNLVAARGSASAGAAYSYTAEAPGYGVYFYKLEDVSFAGETTMHGPLEVSMLAPFRRPIFRPSIPVDFSPR